MRVYVSRHGQAGNNVLDPVQDERFARADPRLTELGRTQAQRLGRRLKEEEARTGPPLLICSPFWRAMETTQILAEILDCRFWVEPGICEMFAFESLNHFQGLTPPEAESAFDRAQGLTALRRKWWPPMSENQAQCDARVARTLSRILPQHHAAGQTTLLLVGHGATAGAAVRYLVGDPEKITSSGNCGLSRVDLTAPLPPGELVYMDCLKHLDG